MCINEAIFIDKDPLYGNKDKVKCALVEYQAGRANGQGRRRKEVEGRRGREIEENRQRKLCYHVAVCYYSNDIKVALHTGNYIPGTSSANTLRFPFN